MLAKSRAHHAPHAEEFEDGAYYFLQHPDAVFEAFRRHDDTHTKIGVSIYW
jgi:hypothetical protein